MPIKNINGDGTPYDAELNFFIVCVCKPQITKAHCCYSLLINAGEHLKKETKKLENVKRTRVGPGSLALRI